MDAIRRIVHSSEDFDYRGAAYHDGPFACGWHVTDNPAAAAKVLRRRASLLRGRFEDLGPGLYFSAQPEIWIGRSRDKWSFLRKITSSQRRLLARKLYNEILRQRISRYISESEAERAMEVSRQFEVDRDAYIVMLSNQPYNIQFWRPEYLLPLGITPGKTPAEVPVCVYGNLAELQYTPVDFDELRKIPHLVGAFVPNSFSTIGQTVVWKTAAIVRFGRLRFHGESISKYSGDLPSR